MIILFRLSLWINFKLSTQADLDIYFPPELKLSVQFVIRQLTTIEI